MLLLHTISVYPHVVAACAWVGSMLFFSIVVVPVLRHQDQTAAAGSPRPAADPARHCSGVRSHSCPASFVRTEKHAGPFVFGLLLGLGAVVGELPNSFLKRQLDIGSGKQQRSPVGIAFVILDQGDFVLGAWLLLAPIWRMPVREGHVAFVVVVAVHLVVNVIGYTIGARKSWL